MTNKKEEQSTKENELIGVGGWLIFPIIGMFITIILCGIEILTTFGTELEWVVPIDVAIIVIAGLSLYHIFKMNKLAKTFGIIFYSCAIIVQLFSPWSANGINQFKFGNTSLSINSVNLTLTISSSVVVTGI